MTDDDRKELERLRRAFAERASAEREAAAREAAEREELEQLRARQHELEGGAPTGAAPGPGGHDQRYFADDGHDDGDDDDIVPTRLRRRRRHHRHHQHHHHRRDTLREYDDRLTDCLDTLMHCGEDGKVTDAMTQALLAVIGSGPSVAVLDSMISANQANGLMYHNSVAHQQKTNIFGMVTTMQCVARLLDGPTAGGWPSIDAELEGEG